MGHHIDREGRFQSDKYPDLPPDKIVVSFTDWRARRALEALASAYRDLDPELSEDIRTRLDTVKRRDKDSARAEKEHDEAPESQSA